MWNRLLLSPLTETEAGPGEDRITSLLGADLTPTETEDTATGDTPVAGDEPNVEEGTRPGEGEATPDETEPGTEETPDGGGEGGEGEAEEEFNLDELETDFAESAYAKAAAHYSKQFGKTLDPNDAGDRAMLRELMDRGRKISELQTREPEDEEEEETEAAPAAPAAPAKTPQEIQKERLAGARDYAKAAIVPEVAMEFGQKFVEALWPGKDVKLTQEQANGLAETFTMFGALLIGDAIPSIMQATPRAVEAAYPEFKTIISIAGRERAIDEVVGATDQAGTAAFPGIDKLIENGTIKRIMDSELKDAVFNSKDAHKNLVAKIKTAYKMARGQGVDVNLVRSAVAKGKELAVSRARKVAAGRTPPGSSRSASASRGRTGSQFIDQLVNAGGSGGRFSRMLKEHSR